MRLRRGAKQATPTSVPESKSADIPPPGPPDPTDSLVYELLANVALRDLTVIERVLSTIADVERGEQDPERLAVYYALDHDMTRLRRSAENALVLAGSQAPLGRTEPMTLLDVARAAASESEDYTRIVVGAMPQISVGPAVADDLAHTLAELMDNALSVSPSRAKVSVTAAPASNGMMILVEDEGIGIAPDQLPVLNARLTGPLVLDPATARQMGLYVVAHLARRHGIYVQLQSRRQQGSTAVAFLPQQLLLESPSASQSGAHALPRSVPQYAAQPVPQPAPQPAIAASAPWTGSVGAAAPPPLRPRPAAAPADRGPNAPIPRRAAPERPPVRPAPPAQRPPVPPPPPAAAAVDRWGPLTAGSAEPAGWTDQGLPRRTRPAVPPARTAPPRQARPADPASVFADLGEFTAGTLDALDPLRTGPSLLNDPGQEI